MALLPLPANWTTGEEFTAAAENAVEAAVNALGNGTLPIPKYVSTSTSATLTLTSAFNVFGFTGTSAATWTLPAISGNTGVPLQVYNRGTALLTLQCAGTDHLYNQGNSVTSIPLGIGGLVTLVNDGTYWVVSSAYTPVPTFDSKASSGFLQNIASATANTFSITVGSGVPYGIVVVTGDSAISPASGATAVVSIGGVSLSSRGFETTPNNRWVWVFTGSGIPTGSQTVSCTLTQAGQQWSGNIVAEIYLNVTSAGTLQTASGTGTNPAISVTPTVDPSLIWGFLFDEYASGSDTFTSISFASRDAENSLNTSQQLLLGDARVSGLASFMFQGVEGAGSQPWCAGAMALS